ncbi:MAG: glycosyltransferase [Rhodospirillales bacterium]|nr:glycosyltransferase [Rhodospirillales bacterium]
MFDSGLSILALLAVAAWIGLLGFRGGFWRADQMLPATPPALAAWPKVVAVIPARNEAATIGVTVGSLLAGDYPGDFAVIVVDDISDDGTAEAAGRDARLTVIRSQPLQAGWTGKLWAMKQGLDAADAGHADATYVLFTDADIEHDAPSLRRLVGKAECDGLDLVSLMARLRCDGFWERLLIPAFVFFFQKLYPFPWVNDRARTTAAAAGGCMLVRRSALRAIGGVETIRDRLIDDCALAAHVKRQGAIWLGLAAGVKSLRRYDTLGDVWDMVARTAFEQLGNSSVALVGTVAALAVVYLAPPLAAVGVLGGGWPGVAAGLAVWWGMMPLAFAPTLRLYGLPAAWGLTLPLAALLYMLMAVSSAIRTWRGRGGAWKGRHYGTAPAADG